MTDRERERHDRLAELYKRARRMSPEARAAWIDAELAGDPELRDRLRRMLAQVGPPETEQLGGGLASPAGGGPVVEPTQIGPYRLLEPLGEGGFGIVYLAEQTEPIRRRVALKIIKPGMDTRAVIARFEAERQALALMDHPHVAKVLDAGVTPAEAGSRSYFVLEFVRGVPISEHCDRLKLGVEQRLALFVKVCHAVQHAHQKGLIHRDLKPSNILVDSSGEPRVIDFGVAKALGQRLTEETVFTQQGQLVGTPEYMSPEQAEMTAQDIDTRSDIYALGVLLYELLTGMRPFDHTDLRRATPAQIQRILREQEPARPSTQLTPRTGADAATADLAASRRTDVRTLRRRLRGDLDWIVMKCLEKDRDRRYETANLLGLDIQRHLASEPVMAGPPRASYRLSKFARRHRAGVSAAALVAVALLLGVTGTTWQAVRATRAEVLSTARLEEARQAREVALAVKDFLNQDLISAAGGEGTAREERTTDVLQLAAERIEMESRPGGKFHDKPIVEASIRAAIGETYLFLGEFASAEPHLKRALQIRDQAFDTAHVDVAESVQKLAVLYHRWGRYAEAVPYYERGLASQSQHLGDEHPKMLVWRHGHAALQNDLGRYGEAKRLHEEVLAARQRVLGEADPATLTSRLHLGFVLRNLGEYEAALDLDRTTLKLTTRVFGADHPRTFEALSRTASDFGYLGRFEEALVLNEEVLAFHRGHYGPDHWETLKAQGQVAWENRNVGRIERSIKLLEDLVGRVRRTRGERHPSALHYLNDLGVVYVQAGRYHDAETAYLESLDGRERVLGAAHPMTLIVRWNLVELYTLQGRTDEVEPMIRANIDASRKIIADGNASSNLLNDVAWALLTTEDTSLRDPEEALRYARRAVEMTGRTNAGYVDTLALALYTTGAVAEAIGTQKMAISLLRETNPSRAEMEARLAEFEAALEGRPGSTD